MTDGEIRFQVTVDDKKTDNALKGMEKSAKKVEDKIGAIGKKMTALGGNLTKSLTLPIVGIGTLATKQASDLNENINKTEVAFGSAKDKVLEFSNTTLKQFGIAKSSALEMASLFGDMGGAMGQTHAKAAEMSQSLVGLAGDLASFKNISVERAQTALTGIYTGETEALKSLGVVMTQVNLEEFAHEQGIKKKITDMTQAELIQLRYNYVMEATKNAQGDYNRTSDGTANLTRTATESFKELSAQLGQELLPFINKVITKLIEILDHFKSLDEDQRKAVVAIGLVVAAIGPAISIIGGLIGVVQGLAAAFSFLAANPVVLIIGAIVALVGAIIYCYNKFEWFRNGVKAILKGIANVFIWLVNNAIDNINRLIKGILYPINSTISALNHIPGVHLQKINVSIPKIPKLKVGTDLVNQDGLAYLHKGEQVVPANVVGGGYKGNSQPIYVQVEAKVREGILFEAEQRINSTKGLQMQFGGGFSVSN